MSPRVRPGLRPPTNRSFSIDPTPVVSTLRMAVGIIHCARNLAGAFAETFLRRPGRTLIDLKFLPTKAYVRLNAVADLRLVCLYGPAMAKIGATAEVAHSGLPYDIPQSWSKAIAEHPTRPEGIAYHARHDDNELCYAIFDRASGCIVEERRTIISTRTGSGDWPNNTESVYRPEAVCRRSGSNDRPRAPKLECDIKTRMRKARSRKNCSARSRHSPLPCLRGRRRGELVRRTRLLSCLPAATR